MIYHCYDATFYIQKTLIDDGGDGDGDGDDDEDDDGGGDDR